MSFRPLATLALAFVLVALLAPTAAGQTSLTVTALEEDDCPEDDTFCFETSRDSVPAEETINATVVNEKNHTDHSFLFDWTGDAKRSSHDDSPADAADAEVERIPANESRSVEFTIPADATSPLYIWCDEPGHEGLGMWATVDITGLDTGQDDDTDDTTDGQPSQPGFAAVAGVAALAVAALIVSRRR